MDSQPVRSLAMAFAATAYQHIVLDAQGVPVVQGANTKVVIAMTSVDSSPS